MNPKIKPVVYFCLSAALWAIPSYYLFGTLAGKLIFYIFGVVPAMFLQLTLFLSPIEKWVRYVPIPAILGFGVIEAVILAADGFITVQSVMTAVLFVTTPLIGFVLGFVSRGIYLRKTCKEDVK